MCINLILFILSSKPNLFPNRSNVFSFKFHQSLGKYMGKTISFDCQGRTHKKKFYFVGGRTTKKIIYPEFFENWIEPHEKQEKLVKTVCYVAQTRFFCVHLP